MSYEFIRYESPEEKELRAAKVRVHKDRARAKTFVELHPFEILYWERLGSSETGYRETGIRFSNAAVARGTAEHRGSGYAVRDNVTGALYTMSDLRRLPEQVTSDYEGWLSSERELQRAKRSVY